MRSPVLPAPWRFAGVPDEDAWGRAYSYSAAFHALFILILLFLPSARKTAQKRVLTEVNFVEIRAPEPAREKASGGKVRRESGKDAQTRGVPSDSRSASEPVREAEKGVSRGKPVESERPAAPSGPIVSLDFLGEVGRSKASLKKLEAGEKGTRPDALAVSEGGDRKTKGSPIVLAKASDEEIQRRESSVGAPIVSRRVVSGSMSGKLKNLAEPALGRKKKTRVEDLQANPLEKQKWGKRKGPFSMEGPLKYRKIKKMELPPYPRWAEERGIEASVSVRLWVDPKGKVKDNMYLEKASGYSELDFLVKEALLKFEFVPIPDGQPQEDEWGVATFRFELAKK